MNKIFNLTSTFKALEQDDDGSVTISGYASTKDFDRAGDSISAEAWTKGGLANFEKNPIILFNHNYDKPIGRAIGLKVTDQGLEMKAKISKSAPDHVAELVKEGILGAFSVGFRVKDADYIKETDGLMIKDAELFEVSVVSVPCNQAATFSLAKSFDSESEYEEFKKTFIDNNSVNLASQSVAEDEVKASNAASDAPDEVEKSTEQETNMSDLNKTNEIDLEAFAKKVAADTAAQIAMKQAEEKALEKAASEKAQAEATQKAEAEAEKKALLADMEAKMAEKQLELEAAQKALEVQLEEKSQEIEKMRDSKKVFADRAEKSNISQWGSEFMKAHILGVMTQKGMNTQFAMDLQEKAGIDYTTNAGDIDQEVSQQIEKEIMRDLKIASLFREVQVNGASTILPLQVDTGLASFATSAASGNLENRGATDNAYKPKQITLTAHRLISSTFMDNEVDELVLVNLLPMLVEGVARAHARAVEDAILNGTGPITGLVDVAAAGTDLADTSTKLTASALLDARQGMGKYGLVPSEIVYIVSQKGYYDLLDDANFQTLDEVGSDLAVRITGTIGAVFGSAVVVSEEFPQVANGALCAVAVNTRNYVIPRLRGVSVEQDYEVMNQRRVIVATQSLGFAELVAGGAGDEPSVKISYASA
jgi:HK97 family phage prohead protease/HK97 family phage major capsid protein